VVFGRGNGSGFPAALDLSALTGGDGFVINGASEFERAGSVVSTAGDVNGDGLDDLLIGAPYADVSGYASGRSYVVFGRSTGFSALLELSALSGSDGFALNGTSTYDNAGRSVSAAGDINGDGIDDLIIGVPYANANGNADTGQSYVIFGHTGSFAAVLALSALTNSDGVTINGIRSQDRAGEVSNAGDINGDGLTDLLIGASGATPNGEGSGQGYVIFGSEPAAADLAVTIDDNPDPVNLNSSINYTLTVTNQGPDSASGITLDFNFPAALLFDGFSPPDWSCQGVTLTTSCTLGLVLAPAAGTTLVLSFTTAQSGPVSTSASVRSSAADPQTNNNEISETTTIIVNQPNEIFSDHFE
jgi:uncharacterized repeat protein (TIGR01451 family)